MGLFGKRVKVVAGSLPNGEDEHNSTMGMPTGNAGIPMGIFPGYQQNEHMILQALPGGVSARMDPSPVTFARYNMSRGMHDVQLNNGWQDTAYGRICNYRNEGYLAEVAPQIPGQSRLYGSYGPPAGFVPRGNSPAQWQNNVNQVGQQPTAPGGPGQHLGSIVSNGSGG
jgi:hypothetical protein